VFIMHATVAQAKWFWEFPEGILKALRGQEKAGV